MPGGWWLRRGALLIGCAAAGGAHASGFALNAQSARDIGQAFSGRAVEAATATSVADNPAGIARLQAAAISAGFAVIQAHTDIADASGTVGTTRIDGGNRGDMVPTTTVPFGYYAQPLDAHWAVGFGVYAPFGLITDYENDFQGRYFGTRSKLQATTAQPTLAYRFDGGWSLGGGVTFNRMSAHIDKDIYNALDAAHDVDGRFTGDDTAWGFNLGALYEFGDGTRWGISYFSRVDYHLDGHTSLGGLPVIAGTNPTQRYAATLDLTTPDKIDLGFSRTVAQDITLFADITLTRWQRFRELTVVNDGAPSAPIDLGRSTESFRWRDAACYALGANYRVAANWLLRGGVAYDVSPVPDATRSVRVPVGDRTLLGVGATWSVAPQFDVDFSYLYLREQRAKVDREDVAFVTGQAIRYEAEYRNSANIFGVQVDWRL